MADLSYPYFSLYKDVASQWRWRLQARNHEIIAVSSEAYHNKQDAVHAIGLVKNATNVWDSTSQTWLS